MGNGMEEAGMTRLAPAWRGAPSTMPSLPDELLVTLKGFADSSNTFLLKAVQLVREPRRRHTSEPYFPAHEAPWRYSLLLLNTSRVVTEDWAKVHGIGALQWPEATFVKLRPVWAVFLHADRRASDEPNAKTSGR